MTREESQRIMKIDLARKVAYLQQEFENISGVVYKNLSIDDMEQLVRLNKVICELSASEKLLNKLMMGDVANANRDIVVSSDKFCGGLYGKPLLD